jgi:hypothetical protein
LRSLFDAAGAEALCVLIERHGGDVVRIPQVSSIRAEAHREAIRKALLTGQHPRQVAWKFGIHVRHARRLRDKLLRTRHGQMTLDEGRTGLACVPRKRPVSQVKQHRYEKK